MVNLIFLFSIYFTLKFYIISFSNSFYFIGLFFNLGV